MRGDKGCSGLFITLHLPVIEMDGLIEDALRSIIGRRILNSDTPRLSDSYMLRHNFEILEKRGVNASKTCCFFHKLLLVIFVIWVLLHIHESLLSFRIRFCRKTITKQSQRLLSFL